MKQRELSYTSPCLFTDLLFCSWFFSLPMLGWSQAFSIPCQLLSLHLECSYVRHRNKLMHQMVMEYWILPFPCNVFFMNLFRDWLYSLSCGFMRFSNTIESFFRFRCLDFFFYDTTVSRTHTWENALLHGIAAAFGVSKFRLSKFWHIRVSVFRLWPFLFFYSLSWWHIVKWMRALLFLSHDVSVRVGHTIYWVYTRTTAVWLHT